MYVDFLYEQLNLFSFVHILWFPIFKEVLKFYINVRHKRNKSVGKNFLSTEKHFQNLTAKLILKKSVIKGFKI